MTNLEKAIAKIYKNQLLKRLIFHETSNMLSMNFYHADVFFEKIVSIFEIEKSIHFFTIESIDFDDVINSNVSDH